MTDLAEIFRVAGPAYLERFGDRMLPSHRRVMRDVVDCRTPVLGGQLYECDCGKQRAVYHSCRNRHCPKCQSDDAQHWIERQRDNLLPTTYGLATCTLPDELRAVARAHQRIVYDILMREAAHALLAVAADNRFIGGLLAIMALLHTWTRALIYHPRARMLFPIGGLAPDGESWIKPRRPDYILPSFALAAEFRRRFESALKKTPLYDLVPPHVWKKRWVADVRFVGNGDQALLYLSRYVFRIAISNNRIESFDGNTVRFRWVESKTGKTNRAELEVSEFIRRYLQHVLPRGFVKVRYYGLWAPASRDKLDIARSALEQHLDAIGKHQIPRIRAEEQPSSQPDHAKRCPACGVIYTRPPRKIPRARPPP